MMVNIAVDIVVNTLVMLVDTLKAVKRRLGQKGQETNRKRDREREIHDARGLWAWLKLPSAPQSTK
jgi:hypothetical protein